MSSVLGGGGGWSPALVIMRGREAILGALGSLSPDSSSPAAAQGERDGVRAGAVAPRRHASPAAAGASQSSRETKDPETGDSGAGEPAAGASPPGHLSAEIAVAILADCFGHC